jgi:hypothetical protein
MATTRSQAIHFSQPYPAAEVGTTGYSLQVPAAQQIGTVLECRILVWNGGAKLSQDHVQITDDASVDTFLGVVRGKLQGALRTAAQRAVWREACLVIANQLPLAIAAQIDTQQAQATPSQSQATRLVALADVVDLSITPDGEPFATVEIGNHRETWPLQAKAFRHWLADRYYETTQATPSSQALQDAISALAGKARRAGIKRNIAVRLAEGEDGALYLDLGDAEWRVVRIDAARWQLDPDPPVRFRRPRGMLPLPLPVRGGSLEELRVFLNPADDDDWKLRQAWLIGVFNPRGPYPILILTGEQGSAKSFSERILRRVVDPNRADLRSAPREEIALLIAATNGLIVAFDNISHLPDWLSDAFCRLATGAGIGRRELYTDTEESLIAVARPIMFNAIGDLGLRGDLVDRAIALNQPRLAEGNRRDERQLWKAFDAAHPRILGAVLDIVSRTLAALPTVQTGPLPRMADFALWVCAAESGLSWNQGEFLVKFKANQGRAHHVVAEASLLATALVEFYAELNTPGQQSWEGTATELLARLNSRMDPEVLPHLQRPRSGWPRDSTRLSNHLRRLAPTLRATAQIAINFDETARPRRITLQSVELEQKRNTASGASGASGGPDLNSRNPDASDAKADASVGAPTPNVSSKAADSDAADASDAPDAVFRDCSNQGVSTDCATSPASEQSGESASPATDPGFGRGASTDRTDVTSPTEVRWR